MGLLMSWLWVKDTRHHVTAETSISNVRKLKNIFWETTWKDKNLSSVTQAGLINNLNDGMVWGLLPILLITKGFTIDQTGIVAAVYPAVWGIGQLFTGKMADSFCKRNLLYSGMLLQGLALLLMIFANSLASFIILSVLLGWGTAMVYPTFLATIAEHTHPSERAKSIGIFRFWRDQGYAIGAILTGLIADRLGINATVLIIVM